MSVLLLLAIISCHVAPRPAKQAEEMPANAFDRTFYSAALNRDVTYRVVYPPAHAPVDHVHVVYLLHGNGDSYTSWSTDSGLAKLLPDDTMLVMPEGHSSYWMNSVSVKDDRYEDFVTRDLIFDAERDLPFAPDRLDRAIVGNSMGGFAAVTLALKHPKLYQFAGALSPTIDYAERPFSVLRLGQSMSSYSIFGAPGSSTRRASDPFVLARTSYAKDVPYIFLSAGAKEPLLEPVRRFDALLTSRGIAHEFQEEPGGHNWAEWNGALPELVGAMGKVLVAGR